MSDLTDALARSIQAADNLYRTPEAEALEDVFATAGDTYQRFNSTWREGQRRESKEGSP